MYTLIYCFRIVGSTKYYYGTSKEFKAFRSHTKQRLEIVNYLQCSTKSRVEKFIETCGQKYDARQV